MTQEHVGRQFSLLDNTNNMAISFLEGHGLLRRDQLTRELSAPSFELYRKLTLSLLHVTQYYKANEQLGLYVDGHDPAVRFKLEANPSGPMRSLLLPKDLQELP